VAFAFDRVCHLFVGGKQSRKRGIAASNQMENAATIRNLLTNSPGSKTFCVDLLN